MKQLVFALILTFAAMATAFAQPVLQWDKRFNGPIANDEGKAITVDVSGNVYIAGSSDGPTGGSDFLTIKYNSDGNLLWSQRYNGAANGQDSVRAIRVDALGNVYITGKSQGSGTNINIVTIKYDSTGVQKWASVYIGTAGSNGGYNLEVDVFGNVYVIGFANPYNVLIKYNGLGVLQWSKNLMNSYNNQNETFFAISPFDGHLIVADGGSLTSQYTVWKLHPSTGNVVQIYNTGNTGGNVIYGIPNSMVLDGNGNIYVTSMSDPDLNTDKPSRIHTAKFTQGSDSYAWYHYTFINGNVQTISCVDMKIDNDANLYVLAKWYTGSDYLFFTKKLTSTGSQAWATPNSTSSEYIYGIPVSLLISNLTTPPEIYETGFTLTGNIKIIKYANNGDTLWTKVYDCGNNGFDIASKMAIDACDNIYITGSSNCNGTYKDIKTIKYSTITPTLTPSGPTTFCQGGSVTLTASSANAYQWSNGATTQSIIVTSSGSYAVTVTRSNGCVAASVAPIVVTVNSTPTVTITPSSQIVCAGNPATLTAIASGGTYLWSNGATTESNTVSPTTTTTYSVTATLLGCSSVPASGQVTVNPNPTPPTITPSGPTTFCEGGSVMLMASAANSYLWSTGATTQSIPVTSIGSYAVTVTGTNGCTAAVATPTVVTVILIPIVKINNNNPVPPFNICTGQSATLTASGATNYVWSTGASTASITVNTTTTYTVLGIALGCTSLPVSVQVMVNPLPILTVNSATICASQSATMTANTANGAANYLWNTGATTNSIIVSPSSSTTYTVTATFATGCSTSATAQVNVNPILPTNVSVNGSLVMCTGQNAMFSAMPTNGGTLPIYQWFVNNNLVGTGSTYSTTTLTNGAQVYCTMMSNALCASPIMATSPTKTITVLALPNVQITANHSTTFCQGNSVVLTADPSGSYSWSTGATTKNITVTTAGNYTVIVTAANGCSAVSTPTPVTVNPLPEPPTIFPTGPIIISCPGDLTSSFANAYLWNTGASTQSITVSTTGDYSVTISDINGCLAASNPTTVECTIGASEASLPEAFLVSPNPSNGSFTVGFFLPEAKMVSYRVLNVLGQVVWAAAPGLEAGECQRKIDLGLGIMPGIYFLETRLEGRAFLWKIEVW